MENTFSSLSHGGMHTQVMIPTVFQYPHSLLQSCIALCCPPFLHVSLGIILAYSSRNDTYSLEQEPIYRVTHFFTLFRLMFVLQWSNRAQYLFSWCYHSYTSPKKRKLPPYSGVSPGICTTCASISFTRLLAATCEQTNIHTHYHQPHFVYCYCYFPLYSFLCCFLFEHAY